MKVELEGEVLEYDPPQRLSYTWHCKGAETQEAPVSTVIFELHPVAGSVRLTVTHAPLAGAILRNRKYVNCST